MDPSYRYDARDERAERDTTFTEAHQALDDAKIPRATRGRPLNLVARIVFLDRKYHMLKAAYRELVGKHNALIAENMLLTGARERGK